MNELLTIAARIAISLSISMASFLGLCLLLMLVAWAFGWLKDD